MTANAWDESERGIFRRIRSSLDAGEAGVLATIVDVEGNSYRRPGSKMLITEDGVGFGSVSAGCLEDEILRLAGAVLEDGNPRIETFDLMTDDVWGLGLGCNGIIDVLLEPISDHHLRVADAVESRDALVTATVLGGHDAIDDAWSRRILSVRDGTADVPDDAPRWLSSIDPALSRFVDAGRSGTVECDLGSETVETFVDVITPPPTLLVLGDGPDVVPVVEIADRVGFRTVVASFRGGTTPDRFPAADRVLTTSPADLCEDVSVTSETFVVVMSHNFVDDQIALETVLQTPVPYVGLMGPRERFDELVEGIEADGGAVSSAGLDRIYTPVGLDLGGGTPSQIALSIVAEVTAVVHGRTPQHLSNRDGPIHGRTSTS